MEYRLGRSSIKKNSDIHLMENHLGPTRLLGETALSTTPVFSTLPGGYGFVAARTVSDWS
jgi:hypothetical protein